MITLKTLPQATAQEIFDQVARHLLTQNEQSVDEVGNCLYRCGKLKCAAGCLIADDEYSAAFEGDLWNSLVATNGITEKHRLLIQTLQCTHDDFAPPEWSVLLGDLAERFGLSRAVLEEFDYENQSQ